MLIKTIKEAVKQFGCKLYSWAILENHFHILIYLTKASNLSKLMKAINGRSSRRLKRMLTTDDRLISLSSREWRVWYNYWDKGIRDEVDFYKHFNYIHHNSVKHGYVKDSKDYPFSSYNFWLIKKGKEWLDSCFEQYPIIDYTPDDK
jgi:putative transposase